MKPKTYVINTLNRGRFILIFLGLIFIAGAALSLSTSREILKIVLLVCSIPFFLFIGIKFSLQSSQWTISNSQLFFEQDKKQESFELDSIDHIRNHIRSGGNLFAIHFSKKKKVVRFWRNKLFQSVDEYDSLLFALKQMNILVVVA